MGGYASSTAYRGRDAGMSIHALSTAYWSSEADVGNGALLTVYGGTAAGMGIYASWTAYGGRVVGEGTLSTVYETMGVGRDEAGDCQSLNRARKLSSTPSLRNTSDTSWAAASTA